MTSQAFRLPRGGRVDRNRRLVFAFNGTQYTGYAGDTLASALLANGVHLVGRSFKYHRPRGIMSAGPEEPNALVQIGRGPARTDPNSPAPMVELYDGLNATSQNCWPGVGVDVGAINDVAHPLIPAGFYYKTFMGPGRLWRVYEHLIRKAAGLGVSPTTDDPDRYEQHYAFCDVLIVGGGPAGLAAALAAGRSGARVILCDERPQMGGSLLTEPADSTVFEDSDPHTWIRQTLEALKGMPEVTVLPRTTCFAYYHDNSLCLLERVTDHIEPSRLPLRAPRQRLWKVRAQRVIQATGAIERPLVFDNNDRPGIMMAGAVRHYLNAYGVLCGRRTLLFTNNDEAYRTALDLAERGGVVPAIVDTRPSPDGDLPSLARARGIPIHAGHTVINTRGRKRVSAVTIRRLSADGNSLDGGTELALDCDILAVSGGWNPAVHLMSQSRGRLTYDKMADTFVPGRSFQAERSAGACNGVWSLDGALSDGRDAGVEAARLTGFAPQGPALPVVRPLRMAPQRTIWLLPSTRAPHKRRAWVDYQNDVTAKDLSLAVQEGYRSVEHVKRYTTTGMGTDQGKTGNVNALGVIAGALGVSIPDIGVTTFRPPYTPVTFAAMAGRNIKALYDPRRTTPMHPWHRANGAAFEPVGQWIRAWYYPRAGETMEEAVQRESRAVRQSVGLLDATTLGKIDIQGRDAAEFLNRIYTNAWSKLGVGRCRYGVMLGEDGMVKDDGVTTRLADNHFHMTTTTGGAAAVMSWLEEWHQTEWPSLQVYMTSVTEQWAVMTLGGPRAREVLSHVCTDIDLSPEAFPFMSVRHGHVAGVPARLFRISFTGELSFEINVPSSWGLAVWTAIMEAGRDYDITPYGTETMHVLRAEKGFIIVGQETDGTVTPDDLGMSWIVNRKKADFAGKRSLERADHQRDDRKQLVGLLPDDRATVLPEGCQIIATETIPAAPVPMLGHVTSSYHSPALGRPFALALVKGGAGRHGERLYCVVPGRRTVPVTLTNPVFVDPEGVRLHG